jgi:hypothetical protein
MLLSVSELGSQWVIIIDILFFRWREVSFTIFSELGHERSVSLLRSLVCMTDRRIFHSIFVLKVCFSGRVFEIASADSVIQDVRMLVTNVLPNKFLTTEALLTNLTLVFFIHF